MIHSLSSGNITSSPYRATQNNSATQPEKENPNEKTIGGTKLINDLAKSEEQEAFEALQDALNGVDPDEKDDQNETNPENASPFSYADVSPADILKLVRGGSFLD